VATEPYVFKAVPDFWKSFSSLTPDAQKAAREAFKKFKANPFDPSLNPHKINRLTALYKRTVHSVTIGPDLRAVFTVSGNVVLSLDIGTHKIYK